MKQLADLFGRLTFGIAVVIGLAITGLYYMSYYDDGSALNAQLAAANTTLNQELEKKKDTEGNLQKEKEMQAMVGKLADQFAEISKRIPNDVQESEIYKMIELFARQSGARIVDRKKGPVEVKEVVDEITNQIKVEGKFYQIATFVYLVSSYEKLCRIHNIRISSNAQGGSDKITLEGQIVNYRSSSKKAAEATAVPPPPAAGGGN